MKAIVNEKYGSPEVLELKEVPKPSPLQGEVLIKVKATSLNDWDWAILTGIPRIYRLMSGIFTPKHTILGSDVAGKVEAVGEGVAKFKVGDDVFGDLSESWGGFAEYVCAQEKTLCHKSPKMSYEEAAAIPQAAMLAVQGLIDYGKLKKGQKILINGAGGGVGTFGVQIAKQFDVEVTGVDKGSKVKMMQELGFDHVIDYTREDFTKNGKQYDVILDNKSTRGGLSLLKSLKLGGAYLTTGGNPMRIFGLLFFGKLISLFSKKRIEIVMLKLNKDLEYMKDLFDKGIVKPVIDGKYTLEQTPDAFKVFADSDHKGKLVVSVDGGVE